MQRLGVCLALALGVVAVAAQTGEVAEETFTLPSTEGFAFAETFQNGFTWVKSSKDKYAGQPVEVGRDSKIPAPFDQEQSLLLRSANKHYGVAKAFAEPVDVAAEDKPLVVQYEVKLTEGLTCGGAYIKLLTASPDLKLEQMDNDTPYTIMFGPDACGEASRVHFIFRHQNPVNKEWEEKHLSSPPTPKKDRGAHLYTLVVRPDNSFEILVDDVSVSKGSLLEDFTPAVNPPKQIDDPTDSKPSDWVDEAKIRDPDATKPDDWDEDAPKKIPDADAVIPSDWLEDEEKFVADPTASQPEDWDEEEDGEWEAPQIPNPKCAKVSGCGEWTRPIIDNPAYKGKWVAPLIDNPAYKGLWKARQIDNPAYFEDMHPHRMAPIGALAVEVWTTFGGIRMDNFLIGHDEAAAKAFAKAAFFPKQAVEAKVEVDADRQRLLLERYRKKVEGTAMEKVEAYIGEGIDMAAENPLAAAGTFIAILVALVLLCVPRGAKPAAAPAPPAAETDEGEEDEGADAAAAAAEDKDEDAKEEKKPESPRRKTRRAKD
uniref:Calnexin n=1 Tax=Rhizochromulina marina TaxID=1034831 RepID=A0A7S2R6Y9_9STRA